MGRLARVVAVDVPHHLTQRGNDRRFILDCDADRATYLSSLRENIEVYRVSVIGYCLMSNHVHLVVVPSRADGLAQALKQTHGRYASYWHTVHRASGHVWQGRYYSCPLDEPHLWEALRYTELNPLRARLVLQPWSWPWSSAAGHCGTQPTDEWLSLERWRAHWTTRNGIAACRHSPAHAYRSTMGKCRIRPWLGEDNAAALGTTKTRTPRKNRYGSKPT